VSQQSRGRLATEMYHGFYVPSKAQAQTPLKVVKMRKLISESSKMLAPDPSNTISWVILIFGKPKFALLSYNIKYLDLYVNMNSF
jgi:hypothetical protein